ncbi:hypothetical protein WEH80_25980 [Actinomycetes bacterium KLBMP 9759]
MVTGRYGRPELPREVVIVLSMSDTPPVVGRPELPAATTALDDGRAAAESAILMLTNLLDDAAHRRSRS